MKQYEDELARKRLMSDHELQRQVCVCMCVCGCLCLIVRAGACSLPMDAELQEESHAK